ncbi:MAG TPA: HAMP domain-containing sensor histidine kinase, partial [Anaeromyxobacteraceae bacterium]|nr:HAMP domain-containing sensor histidine kinase [Anaeromyxobacteraceae bacterium]
MVNEQPREPDVHGAGDTTIDKPIDPDRLLEAVESFGDVPDRDALRERVARTLHDLLGCDEAAVIEEVGCCSALAGPLRAALLEHARASGRPTSVSAGELLAIENDAAPGHVWAVAPLPSGFAARAVVARWRNGRAPRSRELRALGVVARWAGAAIDARDRRAALDAALQASDEFVTAAAHELRTPLTPLRLTVDRATRALESRNDPDRAKGALANVDEHVRRMTNLVDTLLEASRVARGELVLVRRDTDLSAVVEDVLARHAVQARRSGSEISVEAHERIVGRWDAQRLRESIAQLVANALKFGNGTPIRIGLSRCGDVARVAIRDEGLGVDAGDQERIFERFERAVSVRNFGGLGVGLWLAREIARAHG